MLAKTILLCYVIGTYGYLSENQTQFLQEWSKKEHGNYDFYMFTQIYPTAVCRADDDAVPDSCEIPAGVKSWSVHGLWPERKDGSYPQFCPGVPKQFDPNLISNISSQLEKIWPNLLTGKGSTSFWKHEYEKHGTCSQKDSRFGTELLYFKNTMELYTKYNVMEALKKGSIVPRSEPYSVNQIQEALDRYLANGSYVQFHCLKDKKTGQTLLADIRVCIDREWNPTPCPKNDIFRQKRSLTGVDTYPMPTYLKCTGAVNYLFNEDVLKTAVWFEKEMQMAEDFSDYEVLRNEMGVPPNIIKELLFFINPLLDKLRFWLPDYVLFHLCMFASFISFAFTFWCLRMRNNHLELRVMVI